MQVVGAVIGLQPVINSVNRDHCPADPVGIPANNGSEMGIVGQIAFQVIVTQVPPRVIKSALTP